MKLCINCGKSRERHTKNYCSISCKNEFEYHQYIKRWLNEEVSGHKDCANNDISGYVKKYIFAKFENKCSYCGASIVNKYSGKSILQVDHIDGDSTNSRENNLQLLCPNCHAQTSTYMGLNRNKSTRIRRYT